MTTTTTDMQTAVCWELASPGAAVMGKRILLAGPFVGQQTLSADNQRPRWTFVHCATATAAAAAAVALTEEFETVWTGKLVVPPGEIQLHPSELRAMYDGRPISPSLRARIFTSLQRRDPRISGGA